MCCMEDGWYNGWYRLLICWVTEALFTASFAPGRLGWLENHFETPWCAVSTFRKGKGQGHALVDRTICHSQGVAKADNLLAWYHLWSEVDLGNYWIFIVKWFYTKLYCQCRYKAKSYHHVFIYLVASLNDWCATLETNSTVPSHSHHDEWEESQRLEPLQWKLCWWADIRRLFRSEVGQSTLFSVAPFATYICATKTPLTLLPSLAPPKN